MGRKLVYFVAATVDGFISESVETNPAMPGAAMGMEGDHIQGIVTEFPDCLPTAARQAMGLPEQLRRFDTVLEGRGSYDIGVAMGVANAYTHLRHLVFSTTMTQSPDPGVELVSTDPAQKVRQLKSEQGTDLWLVGGGTLAASLIDEIDELIIKLHPVILGNGVPMFAGADAPRHLSLSSTRTFDSGVVWLTYTRASS